jgi:alpha-beta hydrolase superfamily lysophospholipase
MAGVHGAFIQHENFGTIGAGDLFVGYAQIDARMPKRPDPAIAGDCRAVHVNDLGGLRLRVHKILPSLVECCSLLAWLRRFPKLALCAALAGCTPIPFGVPKPYPGHPIVTSGYFLLPHGVRQPYRLYPAQGQVKAVVLALHGYTDSRDGWAILAGELNAQGVEIYAPDLSSFGASANRGHWPGTDVLVDQARDEAVQLRRENPGVKLYIMGESMGGAIGILLGAGPQPPPVDGYILSAPAVWGGPEMDPFYRASLRIAAFFDPGKRLTGHAVHVRASDNEAALIAFGEDPLTIHAPRVDHVAGLVSLMGAAQAACTSFRQPALILYGGHDELIPPEAMRACWQAIPAAAPVTLAYYPPDYHLIPRDVERATPNADILAYIEGRGLPSSAPSAATVFLATGE